MAGGTGISGWWWVAGLVVIGLATLYFLGAFDEFFVEQGLHWNFYECIEFFGEAECKGPLR